MPNTMLSSENVQNELFKGTKSKLVAIETNIFQIIHLYNARNIEIALPDVTFLHFNECELGDFR